jgi:hypothetical protein
VCGRCLTVASAASAASPLHAGLGGVPAKDPVKVESAGTGHADESTDKAGCLMRA